MLMVLAEVCAERAHALQAAPRRFSRSHRSNAHRHLPLPGRWRRLVDGDASHGDRRAAALWAAL